MAAGAADRQLPARYLDASTTPVLPIELSRDGLTLRYFTTLTSLGTPHDITLQERRIESFFPADEATEAATRRLIGESCGRPRGAARGAR